MRAALALAIVLGSGAFYDIVTAPRAAGRYNEKHAISVSPTVVSTGGGPSGFGLSIGGSF